MMIFYIYIESRFILCVYSEVKMKLDKLDLYNRVEEETKSYRLFDSQDRLVTETDEIIDFLPRSPAVAFTRMYICQANTLPDEQIVGKTKLIVSSETPLLIRYIYINVLTGPIEIYEYDSNHSSGLIYQIETGN
jgi:hypothetical protein